jgi:UDP-N-acetylglucosamine/UDP-N-acetylgalactosamine diphosphorylase
VPEHRNGIKFETFIFDALREARHAVTMEVRREEEFSPVKDSAGIDTPEKARRDLTVLYLRWLESCGAVVERDKSEAFGGYVEISPLTASSVEELSKKVQPGTVVRPGFMI